MQLCGILDVLIITCMLREAFTSYFRDHVSLNINQAQTYGGRADVATTHGWLVAFSRICTLSLSCYYWDKRRPFVQFIQATLLVAGLTVC